MFYCIALTNVIVSLNLFQLEPSLATYDHILGIFYKAGKYICFDFFYYQNVDTCILSHTHMNDISLKFCSGCPSVIFPCLAASSAQGHTEILQEVLNEMSGKSFTAQDPDDGITKASGFTASVIHQTI